MKLRIHASKIGATRCLVLGTMLSVTVILACAGSQSLAEEKAVDYRVLATNRTSTMQKEMNEAADAGYRFGGVMGGETAWCGSEVVCVMSKPVGDEPKPRYEYKLLATSRTSTMQEELQQAGDAGFEYRGQTVFKSALGGKEVVVMLERDRNANPVSFEYRLLATSRTSTMQKELGEAGAAGFNFVGITVASTAVGGSEVLCILRRQLGQ